MHERDRAGVNSTIDENVTKDTTEDNSSLRDVYKEIADIFPALQNYKNEHSKVNLQKLCVEIAEFCQSVYASTENDEERKIYFHMVKKLNK